MSDSNNNTSERPIWSPIHVMRNVTNNAGEAKNFQITRLVGLILTSKIDGQFVYVKISTVKFHNEIVIQKFRERSDFCIRKNPFQWSSWNYKNLD